jgi:putative transposase
MKKEHIKLSDADRTELESLLAKGRIAVRTHKRAQALLELERGRTFTEVAAIVGVTIQTVSIWAKKYKASGLEFLTDQPRPGRPPVIDGVQRAKITALACSEAPEGYERWSLRLLAENAVQLGIVDDISYMEVSRILKKTNSNRT